MTNEYRFTTPYERFQEWLNQCPVEITDYIDYQDEFEVTFSVPLEDVDS